MTITSHESLLSNLDGTFESKQDKTSTKSDLETGAFTPQSRENLAVDVTLNPGDDPSLVEQFLSTDEPKPDDPHLIPGATLGGYPTLDEALQSGELDGNLIGKPMNPGELETYRAEQELQQQREELLATHYRPGSEWHLQKNAELAESIRKDRVALKAGKVWQGSYDCAAFLSYALNQKFDPSIKEVTITNDVEEQLRQKGWEKVDLNNLKPGDVVFTTTRTSNHRGTFSHAYVVGSDIKNGHVTAIDNTGVYSRNVFRGSRSEAVLAYRPPLPAKEELFKDFETGQM